MMNCEFQLQQAKDGGQGSKARVFLLQLAGCNQFQGKFRGHPSTRTLARNVGTGDCLPLQQESAISVG